MKNFYKVIKIIEGNPVEHSAHNNWDYAVIHRGLLRGRGISAFITYRNKMVESDVKKIKVKKEGV